MYSNLVWKIATLPFFSCPLVNLNLKYLSTIIKISLMKIVIFVVKNIAHKLFLTNYTKISHYILNSQTICQKQLL